VTALENIVGGKADRSQVQRACCIRSSMSFSSDISSNNCLPLVLLLARSMVTPTEEA